MGNKSEATVVVILRCVNNTELGPVMDMQLFALNPNNHELPPPAGSSEAETRTTIEEFFLFSLQELSLSSFFSSSCLILCISIILPL